MACFHVLGGITQQPLSFSCAKIFFQIHQWKPAPWWWDVRITRRLTCSSFAFRMLIKSNNDKIDVNINVRNSKDNAYNTKVTLSFTPNINFINVEVRFLQLFFLSITSSRVLTLACDLFHVIRQTLSALCSTLKWSALLDTPSLEATWRSVGAPVLLHPGCCGWLNRWHRLIFAGKLQGQVRGQSEICGGIYPDQCDSDKVWETAVLQVSSPSFGQTVLILILLFLQWQRGVAFDPARQQRAGLHPGQVWGWDYFRSVSIWNQGWSIICSVWKASSFLYLLTKNFQIT